MKMQIVNKDNHAPLPVLIEALQNDKYIKALYTELNKLFLTAIPKIVQDSGYEFNALVTMLYRQIEFRQEQIISFYNR